MGFKRSKMPSNPILGDFDAFLVGFWGFAQQFSGRFGRPRGNPGVGVLAIFPKPGQSTPFLTVFDTFW